MATDPSARTTPLPDKPAEPSVELRKVDAERWIAEHGDALWRFSMARTRSPEVAEEIVQETLLAALQKHGTFAGRSAERTWLLGIAAHKVADHFRRARRDSHANPSRSDDTACTCDTCRGMFTPKGLWASVADRWPDIENTGPERTEQLEDLKHCIDALPPGQAQAVWMRDVLNIPSAEVCKAIGVTDTNLWSRMHRARVALRSCLESKFRDRKERSR